MVIIEKCSQHYVCLLSKKRPLVELGQSVDSGTHRKITVKIRYEEECKTFVSWLDQLEVDALKSHPNRVHPNARQLPAIRSCIHSIKTRSWIWASTIRRLWERRAVKESESFCQ